MAAVVNGTDLKEIGKEENEIIYDLHDPRNWIIPDENEDFDFDSSTSNPAPSSQLLPSSPSAPPPSSFSSSSSNSYSAVLTQQPVYFSGADEHQSQNRRYMQLSNTQTERYPTCLFPFYYYIL